MTLLKTIFATFGSLLKLLKLGAIFSPFLWIFAKLGGILSFIPGGSILGIFGAIFNGILWVLKWVLADFLDGWKEPQRLVARMICFALMLGIGVYCGIKYDGEKAAQIEARLNKMVADIKKDDDANKSKLSVALKAKADAEAKERALAAQPPPAPAVVAPTAAVQAPAAPDVIAPVPAAPAKRLRHAKSKDSSKNGGSWVSRFW